MGRRFRRPIAVLLLMLALACLGACASTGKNAEEVDIVSQKPASEDKVQVTVLVKYAFSINTFEAAAERVFPNLDIIQVGNYTRDMGIDEYYARLKNDDLTDMVMTWPLEVGEEFWPDRLLDLSALPLSSKYNNSMLDAISRDGKLYYLPGPSQVRAIVYNKTLFEENGWQVPEDFEGFIGLCQEIEKTGIRALQLGLGNAEVLDTAFVGYSMAEDFSKPEDAQWIADYNRGEGSFGDHFDSALDTFQKLIDEGVLKPSDLDMRYPGREKMLFTRQCAMVEDSVLMARMGYSLTGITDEFALMPFFNPGPTSDWARLYPVCYIGVNKHLEQEQNEEKIQLVMELMEYISTPEGQEALGGDTGAVFSGLKGMPPPDIPEIHDIETALTHGRYAVFPTFANAQGALRQGLAGMVAGTLTKQDVIRMVDEQNAKPAVAEPPEVLGTATADFTMIETGNFVTDVMREISGCEIALFLDNGKDGKYNGKGISARLYQGEQTLTDIGRIMPDMKAGEKGELWKITMTGEDMIKTLENSITVDNNRGGWFYYFSGLRMDFDPTAEMGGRIHKLTDENKSAINPHRLYSIAVMDYTVPEEYIVKSEKTGLIIADLLAEAIRTRGSISPSGDGRFNVVQS